MQSFKDSFKFRGLRKELSNLLATKGISDARILNAIENIPRHFFLDSALAEHSYEDKALPIGAEQTISQPFTVAFQTELLNLNKPQLKVLEIGTGSGYQASVLCYLDAEVYSIERIKQLSANAQYVLSKLNLKPRLFVGDGSLGLKQFAPYDRIIVTCAAPNLAPVLVEQLKPNGIMVIPVGNNVQTMYKITKQTNGKLITEKFQEFKFVPLLGKEGF